MIYYDERSWRELVLRFKGTAWESTWHIVLLTFLLSLIVYITDVRLKMWIALEGHTIFASTMSYLLVFRANNASQRYWLGRTYLTQLFLGLREFVMALCVTVRGGAASFEWQTKRSSAYERSKIEDANDIRASMARINCVRWVLAFAVALKLHTRICYNGFIIGRISDEEKRMIDWYRIRLRGLMTRQEFEQLNDLIPIQGEDHVTQGAAFLTPEFLDEAFTTPLEGRMYTMDTTPDMRQPLAILFKMWMEITKHMNEPWGFKERYGKQFLQTCHDCSMVFEMITMLVSCPIPFPYVHLCKLLLVCFLIMTPLVVEWERGIFANVFLPTAVAMSLLGIDSIAGELENPFGDDANDLDMTRAIGNLEADCLQILRLSGDVRALEAFTELEIPDLFQDDSPLTPTSFLVLCSQWDRDVKTRASFDASFQDVGRSKGSKEKPADGKERSSSKERMSNKGKAGLLVDDEDDPRRPLLGGLEKMSESLTASSQHGFVPIQEFGTETIDLDYDSKSVTKGTKQKDVVGLSDDEDEGEGGEVEPEDITASRSPKTMSEDKKDSSLVLGVSHSASINSRGGFRPMAEFGTETINLMEGEDDPIGGLDAVGLSDDEDNLIKDVIMEEDGQESEMLSP